MFRAPSFFRSAALPLALFLAASARICAGPAPEATVATAPMSRTEAAMRAQLWTHAYNEDQPEHFVISVAPTGSMKPTFDEHSLLVVRRLGAPQVQVGDIILFEAPEGKFREAVGRVAPQNLVCHRVVKLVPGGFQTKGDNNARIDPWVVTPEHLRGVIAGIMFFDPRASETRDHRVAAMNPYLPSAKLVQRLLAERARPAMAETVAADVGPTTARAVTAAESESSASETLPPTPVAAAAMPRESTRG